MASRAGDKGPHSPQQAKAWQALQKEFEDVARKQEKEIRAHARRILLALQQEKIEALVDECDLYDATAKDRRALTRQYLEEHKAELKAAAMTADLDAADFAKELQFRSPQPEAGMTGKVSIPFGPVAPAPKDKRRDPPRHELELSWSGPLMPEANGAVHATPPSGSKPGRWRFSQVVTPYSRTPTYLQ